MIGKVYLVNGKRTPFGKFGGSLKDIAPVDLAVSATKALLEETKVNPDNIDHVILGSVIPSSTDTLYGGRHLALKVGAPVKTPGYVVNRLCGSGIQAIADAVRLIKLGEANMVIASGTENMSMAPHLLYGTRFGTKYGSPVTGDMLLDALTDKYAGVPMGITAENLADTYKITRTECDEYSLQSHQKAAKAYQAGYFNGEISPIALKNETIKADEHLRPEANISDMAKLRSSFKKDGTVTPGTASGVVDGACSTMIASEAFCQKHGLTPIAEIIDYQVNGVDPKIMGIGPVDSIRGLCTKNKMDLSQIDLIEINEAFAPQTIACVKELKLDYARLNIWGGAVALGHPLAASGTRISLTLARQLKQMNKTWGIASACIGGGQGIGILLKKV